MTLLQEESDDGKNFVAYSSRIALASEGNFKFKLAPMDSSNTEWIDKQLPGLTNIITLTGVPKFGRGNTLMLIVNGFFN